MIEVVGFKKDHFHALVDSPITAHLKNLVTEGQLSFLENCPYSKTILIDNKPVLTGGLIIHNKNRGEAWAFIDQNSRKYFISIHNIVRKFLGGTRLRRIEAVVHHNYLPGHRWVKSLGFTLEAERMREYMFDGGDASLYAKINEVDYGG